MIFGAHAVLYSRNADADRAFLSRVLGVAGTDAGDGWLLFPLPPAEVAAHPADDHVGHELYLMCDDIRAEVARIATLGARADEVHDAHWGSVTHVRLPGGGRIGLYQPHHPMAIPGPDRP